MFDAVAFGEKLQQTMHKYNVSFRQLEQLIEVNHNTIHRILNAKNTPHVETYLRIKEWLDAPYGMEGRNK